MAWTTVNNAHKEWRWRIKGKGCLALSHTQAQQHTPLLTPLHSPKEIENVEYPYTHFHPIPLLAMLSLFFQIIHSFSCTSFSSLIFIIVTYNATLQCRKKKVGVTDRDIISYLVEIYIELDSKQSEQQQVKVMTILN